MIHQGIEAMAELIGNERVDDIPLLVSQMEKLNLSDLADEHFPQHGNWQGLSLGKVIVGWLTYLLSQGDHRLNQVEAWAAGVSSTFGGDGVELVQQVFGGLEAIASCKSYASS
jgi:transposase